MTIPEALQEALQVTGLSRMELARRAGLSAAGMHQLLKGTRSPSRKSRANLLAVLTQDPRVPEPVILAISGGETRPILDAYEKNAGDVYRAFLRKSAAAPLWQTVSLELRNQYAGYRADAEQRRRLLETLWAVMRQTWWLAGSAERVKTCRSEVPPSLSEERFEYWLSLQAAALDRLALTVGLFVWLEPYLWVGLWRAGRPQRFEAHRNAELIPRHILELIPKS